MDGRTESFWLYRDSKGQIQGPLDLRSVVRLIKLGRLKEDANVMNYPDGQWVELSRVPEFYDAVIDVLSGKVSLNDVADDEPASPPSESEGSDAADWTKFERAKKDLPPQPGRVVMEGKVSRVELNKPFDIAHIIAEQKMKAEKNLRDEATAAAEKTGAKKTSSTQKVKFSGRDNDDGMTIDLSDEQELIVKSKERSRQNFLIVVAVALVAAGAYFTFFSTPEMPRGSVHLIMPRKNQPARGDAAGKLQKAAALFERDTFDSYSEAENILVEIVEGAPQNSDALAFLCLSYRELWPYAFQDSQDLSAVSQVTQLASAADSFGAKGSLCRVTQQLLAGQFESAESSLKSLLTQSPDTPFFYEMKAQLLTDTRDYQTAIAFIQKANQIMPSWIKPLVVEARLHYRLGQYAEARKLYQTVLQTVRDHPVAQIELGNLEFHEFKREKEGIRWVQSGLEAGKSPNHIRSRGLQTMAQYALSNGNRAKAIEYAIDSYKADPTNLDVRDLIQQLGALGQLKGLQADCQEILRVGEQYAKSNNWLAAQAEFRTAFDTCNPKNAFAAFRAGETLWQLHQSLDAVQWMQKAITTDPRMVEGYAKLASYYASRYEFDQAYLVLQKGNQIRPRAAEILRGYADVELQRNNPKDAIRYGEESLKLYDNDIETNLILVQAYQLDRQYEKAYQVAARAIELDRNNTRAQGLYAEAYAGFQGVAAAAAYVKTLINTYPSIVDYRVTLARIYRKEDRYQDMVEILSQALNMDPNNKDARLMLGQAYASLDQARPALDAFLTVVTLDPTDIYPVILIGNLYLEKGDFNSALQNYERARELNPKYPRVNYLVGQAAFGMKNYSRALQEAQKEQVANPNLADSFVLAGQCYMQLAQMDPGGGKGLYSKAVEELQHALKLKQQKAPVYIMLARAQRLAHNYDIALTMLKMASGLESGNPDLYKERGAIYEMKGQMQQAVEAYRQYLQLSPGAPDSTLIQQTIQRLGG